MAIRSRARRLPQSFTPAWPRASSFSDFELGNRSAEQARSAKRFGIAIFARPEDLVCPGNGRPRHHGSAAHTRHRDRCFVSAWGTARRPRRPSDRGNGAAPRHSGRHPATAGSSPTQMTVTCGSSPADTASSRAWSTATRCGAAALDRDGGGRNGFGGVARGNGARHSDGPAIRCYRRAATNRKGGRSRSSARLGRAAICASEGPHSSTSAIVKPLCLSRVR